MLTLTAIEADVQFFADESNLTISSGTNLPILNSLYRRFCNSRRFPELEYTDSSITLVAGQEAYRWPTTAVFVTEPAITLQRTIGNPRLFVKVAPVQDNIFWDLLKNINQSFPSHYKKERLDAKNYSLLMRPTSNVTGLILRISGQTEPPEFVKAADTSIFVEPNVDRAFALYVAAAWQNKRNNTGRAQQLLNDMADMLPDSQYGPTPRPMLAIPWFT